MPWQGHPGKSEFLAAESQGEEQCVGQKGYEQRQGQPTAMVAFAPLLLAEAGRIPDRRRGVASRLLRRGIGLRRIQAYSGIVAPSLDFSVIAAMWPEADAFALRSHSADELMVIR